MVKMCLLSVVSNTPMRQVLMMNTLLNICQFSFFLNSLYSNYVKQNILFRRRVINLSLKVLKLGIF